MRHNAVAAFPQTLSGWGGFLAAFLTAGLLGGCSIAVPSGGSEKTWRASSDEVTGSIPERRAVPERPMTLSPALEAEDWRRAVAALGTALDPQGPGGSVNWDNPQTAAKGSFTPVGQAYPSDGVVCRAFLAELGLKETREQLQGTACREKTAEWTLKEVKPFRKS